MHTNASQGTTDPPEVDIRIVAPSEVVESLAAALEAAGQDVSTSEVVDPSYLGLDFASAADLATIVSVTLISDPLIPALALWFRSRSEPRRITVETPLGRVTLETNEELSADEIRERLAKIIKLL